MSVSEYITINTQDVENTPEASLTSSNFNPEKKEVNSPFLRKLEMRINSYYDNNSFKFSKE